MRAQQRQSQFGGGPTPQVGERLNRKILYRVLLSRQTSPTQDIFAIAGHFSATRRLTYRSSQLRCWAAGFVWLCLTTSATIQTPV